MLEETPRYKVEKEEKRDKNIRKESEIFFHLEIWVAIEIDFDAVMCRLVLNAVKESRILSH